MITRQLYPQFSESYQLDGVGGLSVGTPHQGNPRCNFPKSIFAASRANMQDEMNVLQIISTILYIQAKEMVTQVDRGEIEFDEPEVAKRIRTSDPSSA